MRRWNVLLVCLLALAVQGCALFSHQTAPLTPDEVLAVTRDALIGVAHDVEAAHQPAVTTGKPLITDAQYAAAKVVVLKAFKAYNKALAQYETLRVLADADIAAINALLADAQGILAAGATPQTEN